MAKEKSILIQRASGQFQVITPKPGQREALVEAVLDKGGKVVRDRVAQPSIATLERWSDDGVCKTPCGCTVEPDGICRHGVPSWMLILGAI